MEFTDREIATIIAARKKVSFSSKVRIFALTSILVGIFLLVKGFVAPEGLIYFLIVVVVLSVAHPQLSLGPKYEDLLKILENKKLNEKP